MRPSALFPPAGGTSTRNGTGVSPLHHRRMRTTTVRPVGKDPGGAAELAARATPTRNPDASVIGSGPSFATARAGAMRGSHPAMQLRRAGPREGDATAGDGLRAR